MITVADAGLGNFASVANMLNYLEFEVEVRTKPGDMKNVTHLILPGVGAFDTGIKALSNTGWRSAINDLPANAKILGICLGMQLLTLGSDEGSSAGLGLMPAVCERFDNKLGPVPHIGWNDVHVTKNSKIFPKENSQLRFYFTHSFYVKAIDNTIIDGTTKYNVDFVSVFSKDNIYGVQFHPEKSHQFGMSILKSFGNT